MFSALSSCEQHPALLLACVLVRLITVALLFFLVIAIPQTQLNEIMFAVSRRNRSVCDLWGCLAIGIRILAKSA